MAATDGRVWNVVAYPECTVLHTTSSYTDAESWRIANRETSVILPSWPTPAE